AIAHRHVDRAKQRPRRRINRQNSMQQQSTYSPAAPHRSKSASPCRLAPERQFTAVLDRQDIASRNQAGGPRRRGRRHLGDGHGLVVQKTRELDLPGPMASRQPTDARSWPRDQRSLQLSPLFAGDDRQTVPAQLHRKPMSLKASRESTGFTESALFLGSNRDVCIRQSLRGARKSSDQNGTTMPSSGASQLSKSTRLDAIRMSP